MDSPRDPLGADPLGSVLVDAFSHFEELSVEVSLKSFLIESPLDPLEAIDPDLLSMEARLLLFDTMQLCKEL